MVGENWQAAVTFAIAVLGAGLGVLNTWQSLRRDRVRLKVRPLNIVGHHSANFAIEVANLGTLPLTIEEVGFTLSGNQDRMPVLRPIVSDGRGWPRRLETREAVTVYLDATNVREPRIARAYARTACHHLAYGSGGSLQNVRGVV